VETRANKLWTTTGTGAPHQRGFFYSAAQEGVMSDLIAGRENAGHLLVMKFGGTSVGSPDAMAQAVDIVRQAQTEWPRLVVVTSALSGVTNLLLDSAAAAVGGDHETVTKAEGTLREKHFAIADRLILDASRNAALKVELDALLSDFGSLCRAIGVLGEASPRALDAVASIGERLCIPLLAEALQAGGVPAQAVEATRLIVTDDQYQSALPDIAATTLRSRQVLEPLFAVGKVPVVTGFIGATPQGVTTTLGRGGSDYTAALLGSVLPADDVWIWTDVDGVMSADPRLVPEARTIPELTFREISELAYYGAKVLHPKAIRPVIEAGISLRVCNTFNPAHAGTRLISDGRNRTTGHIKAVTAISGLRLLTIEGRGMLGVPGVAARAFAAVASTGTSVPLITQSSSEQSICFAAPSASAGHVLAALEDAFASELHRRDIDRIWAGEEVVIITVVGAGMRHTPGISGRVFSVLGEQGVNVIAIAQGSSEVSISLVVDGADGERAVRALHALIAGRGGTIIPVFKIYGRSTVSEFLGDRMVYRNLEAADPALPRLSEIRAAVGLEPGGVPRKNEPAYAQAVVHLLKTARQLDGGQPIQSLFLIGDTHMNDASAFRNLCSAGEWTGAAFIGSENDRPVETQVSEESPGMLLYLANRWGALADFDRYCSKSGLHIGADSAVVIDLDKTAIGARGRNADVIDNVRVQAVRATVASALGADFNAQVFQSAYDELKQPEYHPFTRDNQDYLAYICLMIGSGSLSLERVLQGVQSGAWNTFIDFIREIDRTGTAGGKHLALIHQDIYQRVQGGDPTPFKSFRRNEYIETAAHMGYLEDGLPIQRYLQEEILITQEVSQMALEWRRRGALLFGLSDKPDEASCPTPELAERGYVPIHRIEARVVGRVD
jgi:bifunctional aspartokinase / homoserine dehydrogenase 1